MEYATEGDLSHLIEDHKERKERVSESVIWNIILNLSGGLEYLHKNKVIHRDIKPANIFKTNGQYKLADMNVSKVLTNGNFARTVAGSPLYVCPEVWSNK